MMAENVTLSGKLKCAALKSLKLNERNCKHDVFRIVRNFVTQRAKLKMRLKISL